MNGSDAFAARFGVVQYIGNGLYVGAPCPGDIVVYTERHENGINWLYLKKEDVDRIVEAMKQSRIM